MRVTCKKCGQFCRVDNRKRSQSETFDEYTDRIARELEAECTGERKH